MKRLLPLIIAFFFLTSCAAMLEREATYISPHEENPTASLLDAYRVNTYSGLCSALGSYVEEGMTEGNLHLPVTYPGNLAVDLEKAKRQLMEEDPLGCYALSDITFHVSRIIAYYEVTAAFDYRVPPSEYMALETIRTTADLDARVEETVEAFGGRFTALLTRRETEEDAPEDSLRRVYDARPDLALGDPALEIVYYPETGTQAVAEITLTYPTSSTVLRLRQRNMLRAAEALAEELAQTPEEALYETVLSRWKLEPEGGSGADAALLEEAASQEGLDRGFALVRQCIEKREGEAP